MARGFRDAPVPLLVLRYRRIIASNQEACALFGYPDAALEGKSVRCLYPSANDFRRIGDLWLEVFATRGAHVDERFMQRRDGEIFWARAKGRTLNREDPFSLTVWCFEYVAQTRERLSVLTRRESEIVLHVMSGHTSREIAGMLGISCRTVETHRMRAMNKLGIRGYAELLLQREDLLSA